MDKLINQIFYKAKTIRLTSDEKASLKANIKAFMGANVSSRKQASPYVRQFSVLAVFAQKKYSMSLAVLMILILTGGTSFAATGALPGDLLYVVKLNLNENVEALLAVSPQASAQVNAKHAVARLKEAETLAVSGKLTPEANKELEQNFDASIASLNKNTESLKASGDFKAIAEVSTNLEEGLDEHQNALKATSAIAVTSTIEDTNAETASTSTSSEAPHVMMMAPAAGEVSTTMSGDSERSKGKIMAMAASIDASTTAANEEANAESVIAAARAHISSSATSSNTMQIRATMAKMQISAPSGISSLQASARLTLADQFVVLGKAAMKAGQLDQAINFFKRAEKAAGDAERSYADSNVEDTENSSKMRGINGEEATATTDTSVKSWFKRNRGENN